MGTPAEDWQSSAGMVDGLRRLWHDDVATDVVFTFPRSGETVKAHQVVLMARSHVFFTMLSTPYYKAGDDIRIEDIDSQVFKDLVRSLYEDVVELTGTNVAPLLYAAEKYRAEGLRAACVEFLLQNMNLESVATVLDMAVLYGEQTLVKKCVNFVVHGAPESLDLLKEHQVSRGTLKMLVDCSDFTIQETELFLICDTWAEVECRKHEIEVKPDNKHQMLDGILEGIRFCSMTVEEMSRDVSPSGLLTTKEELNIYRSIGNPDKSNAPFPHQKRTPVELRASLPICAQYEKLFHIRFSCSDKFTLLGFGFTEPGIIELDIDQCTHETFSVTKPPCIMYLTKPRRYKAKDRVDIRHGCRAHRISQGVPFIVPCVSSLPPHDTVFTMEVQNCTVGERRPPFSTLIITY